MSIWTQYEWNSNTRTYRSDNRIEFLRSLSVLACVLAIGFTIYSIFAWCISNRLSATVVNITTEERICGGGKFSRTHICHTHYATLQFRSSSGIESVIEIPENGLFEARHYIGQRIELLDAPLGVIENKFSVLFQWAIVATLAAFIFTIFGYGQRTSDEKQAGVVFLGPLADVFQLAFGKLSIPKFRVPWKRQIRGHEMSSQAESIFMTATFSMLGKLSKADGVIAPAEVTAIEKFIDLDLGLDERQRNKAISVFRAARDSTTSYEEYARECKKLFQREPGMLRMVYSILQVVARADGQVLAVEREFLSRTEEIFFGTFSRRREEFQEKFTAPKPPPEPELDTSDPYKILGLRPIASAQEVKSAYRTMAMQHHPDRLVAQGLPESLKAKAEIRFKSIQTAYEEICAARNIK